MARNYQLEDIDIDGKILNESLRNGESMDWIDLAQDRDKWGALLNAALNLQVL
jgi:hypothetical protein